MRKAKRKDYKEKSSSKEQVCVTTSRKTKRVTVIPQKPQKLLNHQFHWFLNHQFNPFEK